MADAKAPAGRGASAGGSAREAAALAAPSWREADGRFMSPARLLLLQRAVGNRAVTRMLTSQRASVLRPVRRVPQGAVIQRKATHYFINNNKAYLREEPDMKSTGKKIRKDQIVEVYQTKEYKGKTYVRPLQVLPEGFVGPPMLWDWTRKSNLSSLDESKSFKLSGANIEGTSTSTRDFAAKVLKKSGVEDPDAWFSNFKNTTFLGRIVNPPIHDELVQHLKDVEQNLAAKHGGPYKDPFEAGTKLGMSPEGESIKGSRRKATSAARSMHFFGLAIDIEYSKNPYITEKKSDKKATRAVLPRAGLLVHGQKMHFTSAEEADVDKVLKLDAMLETYFSYLKDDKTADLEARLAEAKEKGTEFWKRKNAKQARKQIKKDLAKLAGVWGRSKKTIAKEGFTNLSKELIEALGMHWGAAYGDMMHFDLRNKGTGEKIAKMRKKV